MSVEGSCYCGAVKLEARLKTRTLTACNCSVCRRYGALWAYYTPRTAKVAAARGALVGYSKRRKISFFHCNTCGCLTHYEMANRLALNARMMDEAIMATIPVKMLDGDKSWKTLGRAAHPDWFVSPYR